MCSHFFLYHCYDSVGRLLYVGLTVDIATGNSGSSSAMVAPSFMRATMMLPLSSQRARGPQNVGPSVRAFAPPRLGGVLSSTFGG